MMYGPKQKYRDPFEKQIPKLNQCNHTHVSGRRCQRRVSGSAQACQLCQPVGDGDYCQECRSMLRAFAVKV